MMSRKYNQHRNKATRAAGSSGMDTDDKNKVKCILQELGALDVRFDMYLGITMQDTYQLYDTMSKSETLLYRKIRHPDVVAFFDVDSVIRAYIVEIDGAYHKDFDYDRDYDDVKIAYVKINKQFMKSEKLDWHTWIKNNLRNVWGFIQ